ncbi:MAG: phosphoenolpyruvate--protein phosphotransferase [Gemmatimonadota bacterium]|nr:MAG: phosphoenolpyruvate--protein phosphotransferase [Gemmatimonadota bacterium]
MVIAPSRSEKHWFHDRDVKAKERAKALESLAAVEPVTKDGVRISIYANLELPSDAEAAAAVNADGVGLFRTEFLVVGKTSVPEEEEQYEAFRDVIETLAPRPVTIRTFDLGGDKFPMFLPPIAEENPFLGWRGLRIYEMMPELFHNQVRAILRAAAHGPVRLLVPMVNTVEEITGLRQVVEEARAELQAEGVEQGDVMVGAMLETPAAITITEMLARHVDFFSLGTNDLIQYMLAVDRGNAQLARFFDLYHPALLRYIGDAVKAAGRAGRPICVCGEAASDPLGALLLIGLGIRSLSCAPAGVLAQKQLIRSIDLGRLERLMAELLTVETGQEIRSRMLAALRDTVDLSGVE